jgi:hypothetical protein
MNLPQVDREPGITREDVIEIVREAMEQVVEAISPEVKPVEDLPQDVQIPPGCAARWEEG